MKNSKLFYLLLTLALTLFLSNGKEIIAAEGVKVAIIPWNVNAEEGLGYLKDAVNDMLASRIGSEPAIEIIKESSIKSVVSKYGKEVITEDIAKNIGKEVNADYVIFGSITVIADSVSIDARTIALKKAISPASFASQSKGLGNLISLVDETAKDARLKILNAEGISASAGSPAPFSSAPSSPAYTGKFIAKEKPAGTLNLSPKSLIGEEDDFIIAEKSNTKGVWKSPQFAAAMISIDIADVDNDGKNEIVMIDSHALFIYRLKGQTLELVKEFKGDVSVKNYSVSIADINNNGIPEIYVTRMANDRLDSYVLEYKDNEFKTIASDLKWFIRVVKDPKTGQILIGQKYSDTQGYFGAVQKLDWKDGKPQEVKIMDIPKGLNLYNFEMADLDRDGTADVIALDERDYLRIYNKDKDGLWKELWKSGEFYGGSLNRLELGTSSIGHEAGDFIDIKARIVYADLDGDGLSEIIISRNDPGALGRYFIRTMSYDNGEIIDLTWAETGLEENWKTKKIDGYIADYVVNDVDNDGQKELVILVVMDGGRG
ncbi:MAG TPA: VCBS repeat-containing protein, partial [Thermodesulfobacteriota bacterium]|nr:VCBS repeat-containing protein [Thermodesulfobacteriota bacterium]